MKKHHMLFSLISLPLAILAALFIGSSSASAASLNYTDHPMDDTTFRASFTMSASDIQAFLVGKNSGLANFTDTENCGDPAGSHYAFYATYYHCGTVQKASQIIYDSAQAYGINPQAILATMQKEESLVTTPNPTASQLNFAMGYACPDHGGCGGVSGFFNQIDNGTWQFRTDYELSSGHNYWGYAPSAYPCGPAAVGTYYNNPLLPGQDVIFIDDFGTGYARFVIPNASTATLYCYTPHVFPGSTQKYYSGSYWFVYYFTAWFGANTAPYAFKSTTGSTIYIFIDGYKVAVPDFAILQDYGISPGSVQQVSQSVVDGIPTPSVSADGISPTLSYVIKSPSDGDNDGGAVYLVSVGQKSAFVSLSQFNGFGYGTSDLSYFPLDFIASITGINPVFNYVVSPGSNVFQVNADQKRIIFDYPTYLALNPSNQAMLLSPNLLNHLPSGMPISNREILVQTYGSPTLYLLDNSSYYPVASLDVYQCWGFGSTLGTPLYSLADNSYISPISSSVTLGNCVVNDGAGTTYLLSGTGKRSLPASYGLYTSQTLNSDLKTLTAKLVTNASPLKQFFRTPDSPAVWSLENGTRRLIPSLSNFNLLGLTSSALDSVYSYTLSSIPMGGIKLATGQVVKADNNSAVYVISGSTRIVYTSSSDFQAFGNGWASLETYDHATLDQYYPLSGQSVSPYFYNQPGNNLYLIDTNGCYMLNSSLQTSYGQSQTSIAGSQTYDGTIFPGLNLVNCRLGSVYVKQPGQSTIYWVDAGTKHPFSSWSALVQKSGTTSPDIITISGANLQTLATGSSL